MLASHGPLASGSKMLGPRQLSAGMSNKSHAQRIDTESERPLFEWPWWKLRKVVAVRHFILGFCCIAFGVLAIQRVAADDKPNIILLYIDDWARNGSPVAMIDDVANAKMPVLQMPNAERLARQGMRFSNAYASPQCSPSRVCVQTGQSSPRNGFTVFMNDRGPHSARVNHSSWFV